MNRLFAVLLVLMLSGCTEEPKAVSPALDKSRFTLLEETAAFRIYRDDITHRIYYRTEHVFVEINQTPLPEEAK